MQALTLQQELLVCKGDWNWIIRWLQTLSVTYIYFILPFKLLNNIPLYCRPQRVTRNWESLTQWISLGPDNRHRQLGAMVSTINEHWLYLKWSWLTNSGFYMHMSLANLQTLTFVGNYLIKDQNPRAPDLAEKLSQLSMGPNRVSGLASEKFTDLNARTNGNTIKHPLPVGSRAWHAPTAPFHRPYEMAGDRTFLPRKLVSWSSRNSLIAPPLATSPPMWTK